jgi:hypothetical protein
VIDRGDDAGFRFAWELAGWLEPGGKGSAEEQATALFTAWMTAHPAIGYAGMAKVALGADAAQASIAASYLTTWGAPQVRKVFGFVAKGVGEDEAKKLFAKLGMSVTLAPAHVLGALDAHARRAAGGADSWPVFRTGVGPSREYHAMRLLAARAPESEGSEDWAVVLERFEGYGRSCQVRRYVIAEHLPSGLNPELDVPLGDDACEKLEAMTPADEDAELLEDPDYFTKSDRAPASIARIRALLRDHPEDVWPDPAALFAKLGFDDAALLVVTTAFEHTQGAPHGEAPPSRIPSYVSLAEAIVKGTGAAFDPGRPNVSLDDVRRLLASRAEPN